MGQLQTTKQTLVVAAFIIACVLIFSRRDCEGSVETGRVKTKLAYVTPPLIPPRTRNELGTLLESLKFKRGAELGVQQGLYSKSLLEQWPSAERMYLVDLWQQQENYHDIANVDNGAQEALFKETQNRLEKYKDKTVFLRGYTSRMAPSIADGELDFVYVDARHDYCGVMEDLELYWPKIKEGGLMAGHDYVEASEAVPQDWSVCMDGTKHPGAVKGAVDDFARKRDLTVVACYKEGNWHTWLIRKPISVRVIDE